MIIVIIAGGSGSRLWPLSTPEYPKQLLKINGDDLSLLQQTYERAKQLGNDIYIISETSHIHYVKEQLPELKEEAFIVEPARRGTSNCIVVALAQIGAKHSKDEPIAFLSVDHYIRDRDGFVYSFKLAGKVAKIENRIVLVGVEPDYPATGFGYIEKGELLNKQSLVFNVQSFKEKPDFETARTYLNSGNYLWNCGYFVGSVTTFINKMQTYSPDLLISYQKLVSSKPKNYEATYLELENTSIDYALMEKVNDLLVVPASFDWMDLGSFNDLHRAAGGDVLGNHIHGQVEIEEVENSFIHNQEEKPVAVIGLDNVVVVNTASGILVARKDLSQKVGEISKRLNK